MLEKYIHATGAYSIYQPLTKEAMEKTAEDKSSKLDPQIIEVVRGITPDPDKHVYNLLTALGSGEIWGHNSNTDYFSEKWLKPINPRFGHKTFLNAGIYTHHKNKDKSKSLGEVLFSTYNPVMFRVELIWRIDRDKANQFDAKKYYDRLVDGECLDVSMGCKVKHDICMICGNRAPTRDQYCEHMKSTPGKILPDGRCCCVDNPLPNFFDISIVEIGAAKNAKVMGKAEKKEDGRICLGDICTLPMEKKAMVILDGEMGIKPREGGETYEDLTVLDILRDEKIQRKLKQQARATDSEGLRAHLRAAAAIMDNPHEAVDTEVLRALSSLGIHKSAEHKCKDHKEKKDKRVIKLDPLETDLYKKAGKVKRQTTFNGLTIKIEYDRGDMREGKTWKKEMKCSYGYIPKTSGGDGEPVDVYLANDPYGDRVFVIRQIKDDNSFDEDKVMLGFSSKDEAKSMYLKHIPDKYFGAILETSMESFIDRYLSEHKKEAQLIISSLKKSAGSCECGCIENCSQYNANEVINLLLEKSAERDPKSKTFDYSKSRFIKYDSKEPKKEATPKKKSTSNSGHLISTMFINKPNEKQAESLEKILSTKNASQSKRGEIIKKIPALIEPISAPHLGSSADQKLLSKTVKSKNKG